MSSVLYYRFRSSKTQQRLTFDGTGISVFDIKRGILLGQKLDSTADSFQLLLSNPDTGEEYTDDSEVLPRSTLVEARRLPLTRHSGHGAASHYVSGSLTIGAKNAAKRENFKNNGVEPAPMDSSDLLGAAAGGGSEQDMMNMMFAQQGAQWSKTQQEMATKTKIYTPRPTNTPTEPDKTLPPGYICHRCGQKGHWITNCPSLYDPNWETKKVLRTTGIPKSMLRTISSNAMNDEANPDGRAYLMNANGEYVVAVADDKSWQAFQDRQLQRQAKYKRPVPEELQDPITHELLRDPRKMPCCGRVYSDESIENALIQADFRCPNCGKEEVYIDQLENDKAMQAKVAEFLAQEGDGDKTRGTGQASTTATSAAPASATGEQSDGRKPASDDEDEDDSAYSPFAPRKRRRSSASSVTSNASGVSVASMKHAVEEKPQAPPAMTPMMMPFMFNPFLMSMMNPQANHVHEEDSDYEIGDERPVVGRIR